MAANFRKCILHIGTEKTGTTTLQSFLHLNRALLNERGFYVPVSLSPHQATANHERLTTYSLGLDRLADNLRQFVNVTTTEAVMSHRAATQAELRAEIATARVPAANLLLSNEHCHSRLVHPEEVRTLRGFLEDFAEEFEIVVYLRPQHELAISLYDQALKNGQSDISIFPDFTSAAGRWVNRAYFDYHGLVKRWGDVFGRKNLTVRIFDRASLVGGSIIHDVLSLIGCPPDGLIFPPDRNTSVSARLHPALNAVNRYAKAHPDSLAPRARAKLVTMLQRMPGRPPPRVSRARAIQFFNVFATGNDLVRRDFFGAKATLFDPNFEVFPLLQEKPFSESDALVETLAEILK